jgi:rod shape determining protein RodA
MSRSGEFFPSKSLLLQKMVQLPWLLLILITTISCFGFILMYSAAQGSMEPWASRQILHFSIFFPAMIAISLIDIRIWFRYSYIAYAVTLLLLIVVEVSGHTALGATRWINLGSFKLQPSELMKLAIALALARYFHSLPTDYIGRPLFLVPPLFLILLPFALILKQPDLGTGMIVIMISGFMFFAAGVRMWKFGLILGGGMAVMPLAWRFMHDYQKKRILMFMNPENDPLGAGYNILQSKIAIGSGGFFGKGLLQGSQSQLNFLPEHQTDFIFTMLAEELGFTGSTVILGLYALIILYGIFIALNCKSPYGKLLATGIISMFFIDIFINMAMVMGLVPVVGVPLPLLSYGGTIMMTILCGFGFVLNVHIHRNVVIKHSDFDRF